MSCGKKLLCVLDMDSLILGACTGVPGPCHLVVHVFDAEEDVGASTSRAT